MENVDSGYIYTGEAKERCSGPLALWKNWASRLEGQALEGGHFFPEEEAEKTAEIFKAFFSKY